MTVACMLVWIQNSSQKRSKFRNDNFYIISNIDYVSKFGYTVASAWKKKGVVSYKVCMIIQNVLLATFNNK